MNVRLACDSVIVLFKISTIPVHVQYQSCCLCLGMCLLLGAEKQRYMYIAAFIGGRVVCVGDCYKHFGSAWYQMAGTEGRSDREPSQQDGGK